MKIALNIGGMPGY